MSVYALASLNLAVEGRPSRLKGAVERLFQLCRCEGVQPDVILQVQTVAPAALKHYLPSWLVRQLDGYGSGAKPLMLYGPDHQLAAVAAMDERPICAWFDAKQRLIRLIATVPGCSDSPGRAPIQPVLVPLLRELLLQRDQLLIHGASLATPRGVGMLLIAVSEGGKTTTTLAIIRQKGQLVADDLSVLEMSGRHVNAYGIPKPLHARPKTVQLFPELQPHARPGDSHDQSIDLTTAPHQVYGDNCMRPQIIVRQIYFIQLSEKGPETHRLSTDEALRRLLLAHAFSANQPLGTNSIAAACEVLDRCRAYVLHTGLDPAALGKWLIRISERQAHAAC